MLLFVAADPMEFAGLARFCRNVATARLPVDWARTAELHGEPVLMVANGAGASRAACGADPLVCRLTPASSESADGPASQSGGTGGRPGGLHHLRAIISTGFCGALDPSLRIGDIFVATAVGDTPVGKPATPRRYAEGVLASIDHVAQTAAEKQKLRRQGASAVEMEAAGVCERAKVYNLPFYCVRSVTDLAEETFANDLNAALRADGHFATMQILMSAMRHPVARITELVRLRHRCGIAARALGEFLADCRF